MTNHEILKEARDYYHRKIVEIYDLKGSALWTPDTHKIWDHICRIVALTYHDQTKYSAKLENIIDIDGANKLALALIDSILPTLEKKRERGSVLKAVPLPFRVMHILLYEGVDIMATYFKRVVDLTDEERQKASEMTGKIQLWVLEGRDIGYMSKQLNMPPQLILENMCETIYEFLNNVGGLRCYLKWLLFKR